MTTEIDLQRRRLYTRQIRLADVGEAGQAKLCAAKVSLRSQGFARTIEQRYVVCAGMAEAESELPTIDPSRVDELANVCGLGLRHAAAREVAEGALHALAAIRTALGVAP